MYAVPFAFFSFLFISNYLFIYLQAEIDKARIRHAKELADLKQVIDDRGDRIAELREANEALEGDLSQVNINK